jgi:hypothetical protein
MLNKYLSLITQTNPSAMWKFVRNVLHWTSLPIKLFLIGMLGLFGIVYNKLKYKKRPPEPRNLSLEQKQKRLDKIIKFLPVLKNDNYDLYLPRHPFTAGSFNGADHSTDHQLLRQGQYVFLMSKLGKRTQQMDQTLARFIQSKHLMRGYKWDYNKMEFIDNKRSVSGDMLIGLCLALLDAPKTKIDQKQLDLAGDAGLIVPPSSADFLFEKFDTLVNNIIENDYALLEGQEPTDEPYKTIWNERLKAADMREEKIQMKSSRAMWQPGLETTGAQALTLLAALKVNAKKNKSKLSEKEYWNVFYKKGYALLSLLPTAYLPNRRGYFNDHNCVNSLYVLLRLADTKLEKFVYKFALRYVFNLSKAWYNPYFTGLVSEVAPELVSSEYVAQVREYLYEEDPIIWIEDNNKGIQTNYVPIPLGLLKHSEFAYGDKQDVYNVQNTGTRVFTGLSELASMVLMEPEIKSLK